MRRRLAVALAALGLAAAAPSSGQRPSAEWRTIQTARFRVHFPAPFERFAQRAAASLEAVAPRVTEYIGYTPPRRIEVLITDPAADANGIAFPFLDRPYIELWATPPDPESGLGDFRDWTEILVTHEVAHIVHLTRPRNRPGWLERILPLPIGPVFWNSPRWVAEGYATLVEGALTGSGRPSSSYRAMVLRRFAIEGKLPSYGALDGTSGWQGGSMAYLVGSSYLEWLEARAGSGSLQRLWKRMASRRGGGFGAAFRGVFGRSPQDLYDRFRAEVTARAIEQEKTLESAGLVGGEKWQRLEGSTASPQVSPDGTRLLARRSPRPGEGSLAVWTLVPTAEEARAAVKRLERERELLSDPNEVADRPEPPEPRAPRWTLPRQNGRSPEDPRWMPDGRRVLFTRRVPDAQGILHRALFLWVPETGAVSAVTRRADVSDADPAPDGAWAAAVRNRYGTSELVRVEIPSGRVSPLAGTGSDEWEVWSHPRVSRDGARIAALLHRKGVWRLLILPSGGASPPGQARELPLSPGASVFGPPAWSPDGQMVFAATDSSGVWNLAAFDASGDAPSRLITRVTGGAFSPAPEPDGSALFFLELTARGVDLRRLPLRSGGEGEEVPYLRLDPLLAPPSVEARPPLALAPVSPARPYRPADTHVVRLFSSYTVGPDGASYLSGAQGGDLVGRLDWIAAAAFGNAAGPRGGTVALLWAGLPVELRAQVFSSLERPGGQRLVPRPELDSERRGGALAASWEAVEPWGRLRAEAWGGASRVEALAAPLGETFGRVLGGARLSASWRRSRGKTGFGLDANAAALVGRTSGDSWSQRAAAVRWTGSAEIGRVALSGRAGWSGGSPTRFDQFSIGGASSPLVPSGLDWNRIESPALPTAAQLGDRFEGGRLEVSPSAGPIVLYAERWRAWDRGASKPDLVRLEGIELRLERLIPAEISSSLALYVGAARVRSATPRFDSIRGYGGLIYRP
ncbi:MAG: hypothetical protein M3167_12965 [Acidobacteriota bacterium]|nr:hypothetical protein [Acidobacteriota bacterium]